MTVLDKITLRAYAFFVIVSLFVFVVVYVVINSEVGLRISGEVDASLLLIALISIVNLVMGWLFGRRR